MPDRELIRGLAFELERVDPADGETTPDGGVWLRMTLETSRQDVVVLLPRANALRLAAGIVQVVGLGG